MDDWFYIAVTTIPRYLLYCAFLYKTKTVNPYYYIWLPAITSFLHAGLYFVDTSISRDAAIHCSLVVMIWLAVGKYWCKLDKKGIRYKNALIYYFTVTPIIILLVGLFTWYIDKKSTPLQYKYLPAALSAYTSVVSFIGIMRNRPESLSVSSSIALYVFACIMSFSPAELIIEAFVAVYGDKWLHAEKVLPIAHWAAFLIEALPFALITSTIQYGNSWPSFKKPIENPELGPSYGSIT